ncbi:Zinc finger CCCH domain-containing protein 1 [Bienertia sinuspersici]
MSGYQVDIPFVRDEADKEAKKRNSDSESCQICNQPFVELLVTKCKHYFCERCALEHHSKTNRCFVCNQYIHGNFTIAHNIRKMMASEATNKKLHEDH